MKVLNDKSIKFLEEYLNNASPTGYESNGQKIWMKYLKPYVDDFITDDYGTAVGIINPDKKFKVVITTGIKNFTFLKDLKVKFYTFNFVKNEFVFKPLVSKAGISFNA